MRLRIKFLRASVRGEDIVVNGRKELDDSESVPNVVPLEQRLEELLGLRAHVEQIPEDEE